MDFKNILEGARPFFQGLPQPLSQNTPTDSEKTVSSNTKEKEVTGNAHSLSQNRHHAYHPSVIANHNSDSGQNRNGNNVALLYNSGNSVSNDSTGVGGSMSNINTNNNNNNSEKDSGGGSISRKGTHSVTSPNVVGQKSANTSEKSANATGVPTHPLLPTGFGNSVSPSHRSSSQSHVPVHVPLTIPLPNHHHHHQVKIIILLTN